MFSCCCCLLLLFLQCYWKREPSPLYRVYVVYARHDRESTTHSVTNRTCNEGRVCVRVSSMQCDQTDYRRLCQWVSIGTAARSNEPKPKKLTKQNGMERNVTVRNGTNETQSNERTHNQLWWHLRITIILQGIASVHTNFAWSKLAGEMTSIKLDLFYIYRYVYMYIILYFSTYYNNLFILACKFAWAPLSHRYFRSFSLFSTNT